MLKIKKPKNLRQKLIMGLVQVLYVLLQFPLCIPVGIYLVIERYVFWVRYEFKVSFTDFWKYYERTKKKNNENKNIISPNGDDINQPHSE